LTLVPWSRGKALIWDVTCCNTMALSYLNSTSRAPGGAARVRENQKRNKYQLLTSTYQFVPLAFETFGPWGEDAKRFILDVGRKIEAITHEKRSTNYLTQRISVALQRGNAACILQTCPLQNNSLDEIYYL